MRKSIFVFVVVTLGSLGYGQTARLAMTQAERLEPKVAKAGTVITITGQSLDRARVDEVFLTDHRFDMKVKVLEQTDGMLKIRVPPFAKPGRHQLLVLTAGANAAYLELPVYVVIEQDEVAEAVVAPVLKAGAGSGAGNHPEE